MKKKLFIKALRNKLSRLDDNAFRRFSHRLEQDDCLECETWDSAQIKELINSILFYRFSVSDRIRFEGSSREDLSRAKFLAFSCDKIYRTKHIPAFVVMLARQYRGDGFYTKKHPYPKGDLYGSMELLNGNAVLWRGRKQ